MDIVPSIPVGLVLIETIRKEGFSVVSKEFVNAHTI